MSEPLESDVNQFEVVGYVGHMRVSATPSGREVANLSVGTHRMVREPDSRRLVEKTEWHDVVAFDDLAARIRSSVDKGSRVRVTGYMRTKKWDDKKTGQVHFKHELVALDIEVKQRLTGSIASRAAGASGSEAAASPATTEVAGMKIRNL